MFLSRLKADGFGCLTGEYEFAAGKLNLVLAPNEAGKSTLLAAIRAALYGLPGKEKEQFRPWLGGQFKVALELETADQRLRVERDFADERDRPRVAELPSGRDLTENYRRKTTYHIGDLLTGMEREQFDKTCFVEQGELPPLEKDGALKTLLEKQVDTSALGAGAQEAVERLQRALTQFQHWEMDRPWGLQADPRAKAVPEYERQLKDVHTHIQALESAQQAAEGKFHRMEELARNREGLEEEKARNEYLRSLAELDQLEKQAAAYDRDAEDVRSLEKEIADLRRKPVLVHAPAQEVRELVGSLKRDDARLERAAGNVKQERKKAVEQGLDVERHQADGERWNALSQPQQDYLKMLSQYEPPGAERGRAQREIREAEREARRGRYLAYAVWALSGILLIARLVGPAAQKGGLLAASLIGVALAVALWLRHYPAEQAVRDLKQRAQEMETFKVQVATATGIPADEVMDRYQTWEQWQRSLSPFYVARGEASRQTEQVHESQTSLVGLLQKDGIRCPPDQVVSAAEEILDRTQLLTRKQEELGSLKSRLAPEGEARRREERRGSLGQRVTETEAAHPQWKELAQAQPLATLDHYDQLIRETDDKLKRIATEQYDLRVDVATIERRRRDELPELEEKQGRLGARLEWMKRYRDSLVKAIEGIRDAAQATHEQWAAILNQRAGPLLHSFTGGEYERLAFDQDLGLSVTTKSGMDLDKDEVEGQLSRGTKEQLYLAARAAISHALSPADDPLPLILDEPFAHTDDERFARAMCFLAEQVAPQQQVILVTCHEKRHQWLLSTDPHLLDLIHRVPMVG